MIETIQEETKLSSVLNYRLIAQTPYIHFQYSQDGATVRATEVKPRLDRFLKKKAQKENLDIKGWCVKDTQALNYKLRLIAVGQRSIHDLGLRTEYDIYYGNTGQPADKIKKGVMSDVKLTIMCSYPALRALIDRYIGEFFAVTNFGSMSGKGFGSFIVCEKKLTESQIAEALKEESNSPKCYVFPAGHQTFKRIKSVYSAMKSGISFGGKFPSILFEHMDRKAIGNEKDWLKYRRLVPSRYPQRIDGRKSYHYVRALLGVGDRSPYRDGTVITISNENIQRLASPVFFKVIGSNVYMVANRINEAIYNAEFVFSSNNGQKTNLTVPSKDKVGESFIDAFLAYAVVAINRNESVFRNFTIKEVR